MSEEPTEVTLARGQVVQVTDAGTRVDPLAAADEAWNLYLADKADLTKANYERDLQAFATYLGFPTITEALAWWFDRGAAEGNKVVHAYKGALLSADLGDERRGYAPATIRRRIYALKAVLKRARVYALVSWDLEIDLPPAEPDRSTRGPGPSAYAAVLQVLELAVSEARGAEHTQRLMLALRDRVLMRLLHDSALRRSETLRIEWPNGVRLGGDEPSVLVLGKGKRRHQWVPISTRCRDQIGDYLELRGRRAGYLLQSTVPNPPSKPLDPSTVNRRVAYWADKAGVPFTPHGLRHTATTTALDLENGNRRTVKKFTRHAAEASLDPYDDRRRQDDRRLTERISDPSGAEPHS